MDDTATSPLLQYHADLNGDGYYNSLSKLDSSGDTVTGCINDYLGSFCPQVPIQWGSAGEFPFTSTAYNYGGTAENSVSKDQTPNTVRWSASKQEGAASMHGGTSGHGANSISSSSSSTEPHLTQLAWFAGETDNTDVGLSLLTTLDWNHGLVLS